MNDIKKELLEEAAGLVSGQRAEDYGDATANHMRIAEFWNTWIMNRYAAVSEKIYEDLVGVKEEHSDGRENASPTETK